MIPPDGVKILTLEKYLTKVHIIREFHTYSENFKSLAIIVWAGQRRPHFRTGPLLHSRHSKLG